MKCYAEISFRAKTLFDWTVIFMEIQLKVNVPFHPCRREWEHFLSIRRIDAVAEGWILGKHWLGYYKISSYLHWFSPILVLSICARVLAASIAESCHQKKKEKKPKVGPPAHEIDLSAAIPGKETSNWLFHVFSIDGIKLRLWWQRVFFSFSEFSRACPSQIKYDFISGPGFPSAQPQEIFRWIRWHFGWSLGKHSVSK